MSFFPILAVQGKTVKAKISVSCSARVQIRGFRELLSLPFLLQMTLCEIWEALLAFSTTTYCLLHKIGLYTVASSTQRLHKKTISDFYLIDNTIKHSKKLLTLIVQVNYFNTFSLSFQFTSVLWDHRGGKTPGIFVPRLRWIFGYHRKVFLRFTD